MNSDARGTIVLRNLAGRALRKQVADVRLSDVLYCIGSFAQRERVYLSFIGVDGGQFAVASCVADCDAATLQQALGMPTTIANARPEPAFDRVVVHAHEVTPLWQAV